MRTKDIFRSYQDAKTDRQQVNTTDQEILEYVMPQRSNITRKRNEGSKYTDRLFDSTAIFANAILAASLHTSLTNQATQWFTLMMRDERLNGLKSVQSWLQSCTDRMHKAVRQSNFSRGISQGYLDIGSVGTLAMYVGTRQPRTRGAKGFQGFHVETMAPSTFCMAATYDDDLDTFWREREMTGLAAVNFFGEDSLSAELQRQIGASPYKKHKFLNYISPRMEAEQRGRNKQPYQSIWAEMETEYKVKEGGYWEQPVLAVNWSTMSGETWGRGPSHNALPDIRSLNSTKELGLRALGKSVDPNMTALRGGWIGAIDLRAGGVTVVNRHDALQSMPVGNNQNYEQLKVQEMERKIRECYYTDLLMNLLARQAPAMTATEVAAKMQILQGLMGPVFGQFMAGFGVLIDRFFGLMLRAGSFEDAPMEILEAQQTGELNIDVEYESPLARSQKSEEINAVDRMIMRGQEMLGEDVGTVVNLPESFRRVAQLEGFPSDLLYSRAESKVMREQIAEQQQRQQQVGTLREGAAAAADLAKAQPILAQVQAGQDVERLREAA